MPTRVLIAMSGGLDSSVAAMLLLDRGYDLVGCTFCNLSEHSKEAQEAHALAERLGFEHHVVDYREIFRREVICPFVADYNSGRTPNPCVQCNSHIKWGALWGEAQRWGCEALATGHYARIAHVGNRYLLQRAADEKKDQTYFLWRVGSTHLEHTLFPLGDYTKQQVRDMARERGFDTLSGKAESQEICFVPGDDYRRFLVEEGCEMKRSYFVDARGVVVGEHSGFQQFTIGQRKGLGIALGYPAYVTHIDAQTGYVTLGLHDDLFTRQVPLQSYYFDGDSSRPVQAQIRYRSIPTDAYFSPSDGILTFVRPVWAVTPGQSAVFYQNNLVAGGGIIA